MQEPTGSDFLALDPGQAPPGGLTRWLVDEVRAAVADGRLADGAALPPSRTLAAELGCSRGVVVEVYRRLTDEGLATARTGAGTVVTAPATVAGSPSSVAGSPSIVAGSPSIVAGSPSAAAAPAGSSRRAAGTRPAVFPVRVGPDLLDLSPGVPDLTAFPRAAWLRTERRVLMGASTTDLGYGDPRGTPRLRHELAAYLARTRGLRAAPDEVVVVAGVAQSLALVSQVLVAHGRPDVGVEDPGSRGAVDELVHWGVRPHPVPVDAEGAVVEALAATPATAVLLTPAHQFPTGVVLSATRRRQVLAWARDHDGLVVEDDYDAEHRYDRAPVPALQASAPDRVAHTGSTSKTLAPGLRLGWLVVPEALRADVLAAKHASDLGSPALPQLVLADLLASGAYERHLRTVRARQRARRDAVLAALARHLPDAAVDGVAAGLHLTVRLPHRPDAEDTEVVRRAAEEGVAVHALSWHRHAPGPAGLVVGYAAHPPGVLADGVERLARAVEAPAPLRRGRAPRP